MIAVLLGFTAVPVVAALLSGSIAVIRTPGPRVTSGLQHFAAGVVFSAAAVELLPTVLTRSPLVAIAGFAVGIAVMFTFRAVSDRIERRREVRGQVGLPIGLAVATAVDFFIDGIILGAGFATDSSVGILLTIALAVEYLFVGLSLAASFAASMPKRVVAFTPAVLALLTVVGAVLGAVLLQGATAPILAGVLAFGAVAFMYLATEELLVEAHHKGETAIGSIGFFVGFLVYLVIAEVLA
jgi:zinc transporter, ZIP family